jgi:hypothetical protein
MTLAKSDYENCKLLNLKFFMLPEVTMIKQHLVEKLYFMNIYIYIIYIYLKLCVFQGC